MYTALFSDSQQAQKNIRIMPCVCAHTCMCVQVFTNVVGIYSDAQACACTWRPEIEVELRGRLVSLASPLLRGRLVSVASRLLPERLVSLASPLLLGRLVSLASRLLPRRVVSLASPFWESCLPLLRLEIQMGHSAPLGAAYMSSGDPNT